MPLQNRVTPFGEIVAIPQRGMLTGNRGIIHDPATRTLLNRRWSARAWIVCTLDFRGRRRDVMATRSWTELFFLDEATALAAGHRPCFFCRRADAEAFRAAWAQGQGRSSRPLAPEMDAVLHAERIADRAQRLHELPQPPGSLPDGAMLQAGPEAFLIINGRPRKWTPDGYRAATLPAHASLITPPSTLKALAAGYRPRLHPSAVER